MPILPFTPMSPILTDRLPEGGEWTYQLKWDGFRIIAFVDRGRVELISKRMTPKTKIYPELVEALSALPGTLLLDGEAVVLDPETGMPSFQRMQQRDKTADPGMIRLQAERNPVHYVLIDLLACGGEDLRPLPFAVRYEALKRLAEGWRRPLYLPDNFPDGHALWQWVAARGWEGVVAKRLDSPYSEGKEHRDWYKRKTVYRVEAEAVGILIKEGRISSLAMRKDGAYFGRISSGLDGKAREKLARLETGGSRADYFDRLPDGLRGAHIRWLTRPLPIEVSGREKTEAGVLRHPKLVSMGGEPV